MVPGRGYIIKASTESYAAESQLTQIQGEVINPTSQWEVERLHIIKKTGQMQDVGAVFKK